MTEQTRKPFQARLPIKDWYFNLRAKPNGPYKTANNNSYTFGMGVINRNDNVKIEIKVMAFGPKSCERLLSFDKGDKIRIGLGELKLKEEQEPYTSKDGTTYPPVTTVYLNDFQDPETGEWKARFFRIAQSKRRLAELAAENVTTQAPEEKEDTEVSEQQQLPLAATDSVEDVEAQVMATVNF